MRKRNLAGLHRIAGVAAGTVLVVIAITGILLHHPRWLGTPSASDTALAVDPGDPDHLLRGTTGGLYRSTDGGRSWIEVDMLLPVEPVAAIAFDGDRSGHVYVLSRDWGLVHSTDGGRIWENVSLGMVPAAEGVRLNDLALGPGDRLRIATSHGLFVSDNLGRTWDVIGADSATGRRDLRALVHRLHTGYGWGAAASWLYDLAAASVIVLVVTGIALARGRRRLMVSPPAVR